MTHSKSTPNVAIALFPSSLKADVGTEDRRLRGPMWFSVDDRGNVHSVTIEATDGRDRMRLNWDRR